MQILRPSGLRYHRRDGGVPWDYQTASFPTLDAATNINISSIVPATAKLVHVHLYAIGSAANLVFNIRPDGFVSAAGFVNVAIIAAGPGHETTGIIPITSSGIVEYYRSTGISTACMTILGWFY